MTVKSAPYFWLVCDGCGCSSADGDYSAWSDIDAAITEARGSDWRLSEDTDYRTREYEGPRGETIVVCGNEGHYCPTCTPPWCLGCGRPITDDNPRAVDLDHASEPAVDSWECRGWP